MFLAPFIATAIMAAIFSLFMAPRFEVSYPSIKYITSYYPSLIRNLVGAPPPKPYQQTSPKTIINSNFPTHSDTIFGDQQAAWKPVETYDSIAYDDYYYSDNYNEEAIHGWRDDFEQPETAFESGKKQAGKMVPKTEDLDTVTGTEQDSELMLKTETKEYRSLRDICEVLMLSNIEYKTCHTLNQPIQVNKVTVSSPWTQADEMGVRWKEVKEGEDKGCTYFIKAESVPLRLSATPKADGTTKLSYFTKNTIGKYCSKDNDPEKVEKFYKSLFDDIRPAKLTVFLNTKLFRQFTIYDLFEYQMLMDAFLIALYQNVADNGVLTRKAMAGFLIMYTFAYSLYYMFLK